MRSEFNGADAAVIDVNLDGLADIIAMNNSNAYVRSSNGDGTYAASISSPGFAIGFSDMREQNFLDVSGDGLIDAVTINGGSAFTVHLGGGETITTTTGSEVDLTTQEGARTALTELATVSADLSLASGLIGAQLSRLQITSNFLNSMKLRADEARSRILDVDVADETANLLRLQIRQQAATAVLAQANQTPNLVLALINPKM